MVKIHPSRYWSENRSFPNTVVQQVVHIVYLSTYWPTYSLETTKMQDIICQPIQVCPPLLQSHCHL
jgi:hypothetical protein